MMTTNMRVVDRVAGWDGVAVRGGEGEVPGNLHSVQRRPQPKQPSNAQYHSQPPSPPIRSLLRNEHNRR